jgi:hypothetical protein
MWNAMSPARIESKARGVTRPEHEVRTTARQAVMNMIEVRWVLTGASFIEFIEPSRYMNRLRMSNAGIPIDFRPDCGIIPLLSARRRGVA